MSVYTQFLDLIAWSEGTSISSVTKNDGYDVIVSGLDGPSIFTDYTDHPFAPQFNRPSVLFKLPDTAAHRSTAAGRYQILYHWWVAYKKELNLSDFSPASQDQVAIQQIRERDALKFLTLGNIEAAITACSNIWASLPGNNYGQAGGKTMEALLEKYKTF